MTCLHHNSAIKDTRPEGFGHRRRPYRFLRSRRHKCLECGAAFITFEMTEQQMKDYARLGNLELKSRITTLLQQASQLL